VNLSQKQKHFVERNRDKLSSEALAKHLGLQEKIVMEYLRSSQAGVRPQRDKYFKILALSLPVLFFLLLEVALRLFNYGPNLEIFTSFLNDPRYLVTNASVGRRFFFAKDVAPATSYDAIRKVKPANGYRIFILGGSAAAGFPYYHNGAFSRMLATRLEDVFPDRPIEVFNLALPAVSSYAVLDFADELTSYEPDAFLIYAGHNEFYGALGIASTEALGRYRSFVNIYLKLEHSKVFFLSREFIGWVRSTFLPGGRPGNRKATLMERMVAQKTIQYRNDLYNNANEIFRGNLEDVISVAKQHGIRVLLSDLVSNIYEQPPFESILPIGNDTWFEFVAAGDRFLVGEEFENALREYRKAEAMVPDVASLQFSIARCQEALKDYRGAKATYYRAKDLDGLRFRASEDFNATIDEVAIENQVPLVRMKSIFEANSPNGLIGNNLMLEHLHPNLRGYFLMAKGFFEAMRANDFIESDWDTTRIASDEDYWSRNALTAVDLEVADIRIRVLTAGWPFKKTDAGVSQLHYEPKNKVQEMAYALFSDKKTWEVGHVELGEHFGKTKQLNKAAAEYAALMRGTPYNVSPFLRYGLIKLELGDYKSALETFLRSLKVDESEIAHKWIGSIYVKAGNATEGLPHLEKALQMNPHDPESLFNIAVAYASLGNFEQARTYCSSLQKVRPDFPGVARLWHNLQGR